MSNIGKKEREKHPQKIEEIAFLITAFYLNGGFEEKGFDEKTRKKSILKCNRRSEGRRKISFYTWQMRLVVL